MDGRKVLILTNPKAGARPGHGAVDRLRETLIQCGYEVQAESNVQKLSDDAHLAFEKGDLRAVVAAGGDGTAALVANKTPRGTPLAILPLGTENLLAKFLGMPLEPEEVARVILDGEIVLLDAGQVGDRLFLLMMGCGFDADVVRRLHRERVGNIHHLSYAKPILDAIRSYDYPELRIYCLDSGSAPPPSEPTIMARWAFVVNLPRYAGGLQLAPKANGKDGQLDVCTFKHGSLWNGLMYLGGIALGQHESWSDCKIQRMKHLRIEADGEVPYQLDGDPGGVLPVEIQIQPQRLTLFAPNGWSDRQKDL